MLAAESGPWPLRKALALWSRRQLASDFEAAQRVTTLVSISRHVQARILRWWDRPSEISIRRSNRLLLPAMRPRARTSSCSPGGCSLQAAGRCRCCRLAAGVRLVVAGEGRMQDELRQLAGGSPLIEFVGRVSDEELRDLYRRCAAFIFPGEEDFGIVMAEAQSCGAPVIARQIGGAMDIVESGVTGDLYDVPGAGRLQHVEALSGTMRRFDHDGFDSQLIAESAQRFSRERSALLSPSWHCRPSAR